MSVRDSRIPPFAWVGLDALSLIAKGLPRSRQPGARNTVLALAEAAARRHDGKHIEGDTLKQLALNACVSERWLRGHLQDLAQIGLVQIVEHTDHAGRDLPTLYVLRDGPDETSARSDVSGDVSSSQPSGPTRARERGQEEEQEQEAPQPPASGGRRRDWDRYQEALRAWAPCLDDLDDDTERAWQGIRERLRERVGDDLFATWLAPLHLHLLDEEHIVLAGPREITSWVGERFAAVVAEVTGRRLRTIACVDGVITVGPPLDERQTRQRRAAALESLMKAGA